MMNIEKFSSLMNNQASRENAYQAFVCHYKEMFRTTINIAFSNKIYREIDKESFFYNGFQTFLIKEVRSAYKVTDFDSWVREIAQKKVKEARRETNKALAKSLTEEGGVEKWMTAFSLILMEYKHIVDNVIRKCFDDPKYASRYEEIGYVLMSLFNTYRIKSGANAVNTIDNYENWLFRCLYNFANNKKYREEIDTELGMGHYDIQIVVEKPNTYKDEMDDGDDNDDNHSDNNDLLFDIEDEITTIYDGGRERINKLLNIMPNQRYAELIRMLIVEEWTQEEVVEELQIPPAQIYNLVNRAMVQLVTVALPEIQRKCRKLFKLYGSRIEDEEKRHLLADFFAGKTIEQLSVKYRMTYRAVSSELAITYRELLKIIKRDPLIFEKDDKEDYNY